MKFMVAWQLAPGNHKPAAEAFIKSGAPPPAGLTLLGRWHAPGSARGWALFETDDATHLAEHMAKWANLLEAQVTPVLEDAEAGQALAKVYGS